MHQKITSQVIRFQMHMASLRDASINNKNIEAVTDALKEMII